MRTKKKKKSSSKELSVFEFNEEDELVEQTSRKLLGKFKKKPTNDNTTPVTKYSFLQCCEFSSPLPNPSKVYTFICNIYIFLFICKCCKICVEQFM